jgi:predicted DCC family thiol-disulfide oxidoreductase YuxK
VPANSHAVILFDGVCNLCNASVRFVLRRDRRKHFRFASLQSEAAKQLMSEMASSPRSDGADGRPLSGPNSMVLLTGGRCFVKSDAVIRIAGRLGRLWPLLWVFAVIPRSLRDGAYDWVARNRYRWFGRTESCPAPAPGEAARFIS